MTRQIVLNAFDMNCVAHIVAGTWRHPDSQAAQYKDLRYWLEKRPARLTADANVPLLPPIFHHAIVAGTITRLAESNVQVENQVVWPGVYQMQLRAIVAHNRRHWEMIEAQARTAEKPYLL